MNDSEFQKVLDYVIEGIEQTLGKKASEYANDADRLHNFHVAAALRGCTPIQAAAGMMAKHTVSVYDMAESGRHFDSAVWDEKITDHINYLILIRALAEEDERQRAELPAQNPDS